MTQPTTRRGILSAIAIAPIAIAAPALSAPATQIGVSPELLRLIAAHDASKAAHFDHEETVLEPLAELARQRSDALPHSVMTIGDTTFSTASRENVGTAQTLVAIWREKDRLRCRPYRLFLAAEKRRVRDTRRIWRQTGATAATERQDALGDAWCDAQYDVAHHPVSTPADLHAKLAFMQANEMGQGRSWLPELLADATRLAKMEG